MDIDRVGIVVKQQNSKDSEKIWYVKDFRRIYGPLSWHEIEYMYKKAKITPLAKVRKETWPKWVSLASIFLGKAQKNVEVKGLDLSNEIRREILSFRYIVIYYFGLFVFLVGLIFYIMRPAYGFILIIVSFILEIVGQYYHDKYVEKRKGVGITIVTLVFLIFLQSFIVFFISVLMFY